MLRCPVCGSESDERSFIETYTSPFNNQEYKLYHCQSCDLQWWEPLKIIPEFYEEEGSSCYAVFHLGLMDEIGKNHKMFFKMIPVKSGRLLDVGCGDGVFLKEARKFGYEVWGIDFDSKSIKVAQEKWGLKNTFVMTPEEFANFSKKEGLKFDVITFFDVLEHQDRPKEFLETIKSMLKPGGWIAGSVPNRESYWIKKIYRELNPEVDNPPQHLLRFSKISLQNLFQTLNLYHIDVNVIPNDLGETVGYLSTITIGDKTLKKVKKVTTGSEYAGERTSIYKNIPLSRKIVFKTLKVSRNLIFLIPAIIANKLTQGSHFYFQAKESSHG